MIEFNNPLQEIINVSVDLFPEILNKNIYIQFDSRLGSKETEGPYGETFIDDKTKDIIVSISGNLPIIENIEILAHELSHVIVGIENDHNEIWEDTFNRIFVEYSRRIDSMVGNE
jgi:hypothetical protein